jgi:hypothetical protein
VGNFFMRVGLVSMIVLMGMIALAWTSGSGSGSAKTGDAAGRVPVLVELFTSEGCSSCPPADKFLQELDRQPVAGAEMIVLSEHVDYWNHIGWNDPYSARSYSDRQSAYAKRFDLGSPYTPQMVVDGSSEFLGSDPQLARKAFARALQVQKVAVQLSSISIDAGGTLHVHVETGPVDGDVMVAVALNHAESQVLRGENGGRTLTHTAVVRTMMKAGTASHGQAFAQDVQLKLEPGLTRDNLRVIAFVQGARQGKVLGATMEKVPGS